jgi:hypothetical protein
MDGWRGLLFLFVCFYGYGWVRGIGGMMRGATTETKETAGWVGRLAWLFVFVAAAAAAAAALLLLYIMHGFEMRNERQAF